MKITLNGKEKNLPQTHNLREIVHQFCKNTERVIAEVNGQIVRNPQWDQTILKDGDTVELVSFVGGG